MLLGVPCLVWGSELLGVTCSVWWLGLEVARFGGLSDFLGLVDWVDCWLVGGSGLVAVLGFGGSSRDWSFSGFVALFGLCMSGTGFW